MVFRVSRRSAVTETGKVKHPFDKMNNIVAHMLLHLTASSRFEGSLNVDINEITMNLVPFPSMHYLCAGLSPLYALADVSFPPRRCASTQSPDRLITLFVASYFWLIPCIYVHVLFKTVRERRVQLGWGWGCNVCSLHVRLSTGVP